ncbi:eisosome protein SEG2-like isoform X5 [Cotesia glomerata]|uniref:eisosome protein SEG2-like isoform X5 n=1 Tax=Cotesia glomerata TaxID=32391 RepID=UPI001D016E34|nr:eisosome protein SEG2-like isoform X5 [Cotesia glomerata]
MDLPATQLLNDEDDDSLSSQSLNSSQMTPKRVHQVANLCIGKKKYPLFRGINKIGRHPGCDVCINDLSVSKNHAEIEIKSNIYYICDLRSSNKTRIDNESLRPDRFYQILDGSKLTFGIINAQFLLIRDSNDSIIVPETPAPGLKLRYDGNRSSVTDSDDSVVLGTQEAKDEAVFAKPTKLPIRSPSTRDARANNARRKLNSSIHDIETQRQSEQNNDPSIFDRETQHVDNSNKKKSIYDVETQRQLEENNDPSIFDRDTQQVDNSSNKKKSIYDLETQQLEETGIKNEVFDLATQRLPEETDVESDIYAMSTQQISTTDNRGIHELETQKMSVKDEALSLYDLATQPIAADDDIYDCETQRINKQFEITKSKFKKNRVPTKSPNVSKAVPVAPRRNYEEADKKPKHVSTVVDDSETDDELVDNNEIQSKQSSSVHQSSSGITNTSKKSKDNDRTMLGSTSVNINTHNHIIAETDDESETDDEEAVINQCNEIKDRSKIDDKKTFKNNAVVNDSDTDDEEFARIQDQEQRKINNDSDFESHDEIPESCVINVDKNKILKLDSEAESNACPSPVLVDFSKIQHPGSEQNYNDDDDETDDEELESLRREVDDKKNQGLINKINELKTCDQDQDLDDAPTQLLNLETQKINNGIEDTQKILETQRDDLEPTQLIDSQAIFLSVNKINKINKNSQTKNKTNDDSIDSVDLENAPTQIINFEGSKETCEKKNDNLEEKSPVIKSNKISRRASSTPLSSGKRKINFASVKNCTVDLDKLQGDNLNSYEKKIKKKELENDKVNSDLHNDSLVRNLDAMFGGSNDDELEDAIPLQTQQLEEILNDVPEKLHSVNNFQKPGSQENKINLVNKKCSESQVDSGPDTQEAYFAKLSSRKKKSNILVDSQGSSSSQKSEKSQGKAAKKVVYAPGTAGFSNGVPVEGDESVAVYESPEKKLKTKVTEKGAKPENEKKQTVNPVNEDDFFAGLPDVRVAGTDANPANSTVYSSDSEDDYSSGNIVQKLKKSMAKIKAMSEEDDDGIFSNSKIIPNSSFSHSDVKLPKLKSIDDDGSSSDGEVDFVRLKQLADRLLNANDKEKILTGLKKVGSKNKNKVKVNKEAAAASKVADRKSTRKRVLPQKLKSGAFVNDDGDLNEGQDHTVPAKRARKARKNSKSINSSVVEKAQAETKKKAPAKRSKKVNEDQSLLSASVSSGTEDQKTATGVEAKKKTVAKRSKKVDVDQSLLSASVSSNNSNNEEHNTEVKKKTAAKRTKKAAADQTTLDTSTSSASSSTLNSTIASKRSRNSVVDSPSTSARSRHSHRPAEMQYKIMFTGIDYETHEQAVQSLGGVISNDPMTGTILVTDKVRRTLKFLCAISRGIPIVSENWINASIKSNKLIETDKYILHDSAAEAKFGFNLKQSLIKSKEKSLLHNLTFVVTSGVNQPSFNELKNMIQVAGGKALVRPPKTWTNTYIISCAADISKLKKLTANVPNDIQVPVVTTEFLMSGILKQELNAEEHKLSF